MSQQSSVDNSERRPVIVGVDWADREHVACVMDDNGRGLIQKFDHDPEAITLWINRLKQKFPQRVLQIALEQSRGALIHALQSVDGVELYPLNPKQLARFREAVYPSGRKSDPCDAELLATFLANHREKLHRWEPDIVETRMLAELVELRRKVVDERKSQQLRLLSTLKQYFPLIVALFKDTLISEFTLQLLKRWPSLTELQRTNPKTLRNFLYRHGVTDDEQQTTLIKTIRAAIPLTKDPALMETYPLYVQCLVQQILELNKSVAQFDQKLKVAVAKHPDEPLFRSYPGAGDVLVPRLIAAFGSDRDRYQSAEEVQSYTGIAPIVQASGKSCIISKRIFCPKFLRQTFHEFADQARRWSSWSRAYYKLKRAQGMKHQAAVRALAFKWIRIMFHLWKTRTIYSEAFYIQRLKQKASPIIAFLDPI